ncbi:hypothetical protein JHK87_050532 [Glycine soja]|nr:hypothetical protein JHK87_050532 [Glycine soja]
MDEYVDSWQEIGNHPNVELVDTDDINFLPFGMIPTDEGIVFECPIDPKVITISEDMSLATLGKTIFDANGGYEILIDGFYHQPNYIGDGCVAYDYKEFKHNDDVGKMFSSIQNLVPKVRLS